MSRTRGNRNVTSERFWAEEDVLQEPCVSEVISVAIEVHAKVHRCSFVWRFHVHSQELSKIAMPVVFNEPLSFLQRMSEYMEHTHLIHKACSLSDSIDRMQVCIEGQSVRLLLAFKCQKKYLMTVLSTSLVCWQFVAAFAVSAVASQWERTGKPFNPLLGETYEMTRYEIMERFLHD